MAVLRSLLVASFVSLVGLGCQDVEKGFKKGFADEFTNSCTEEAMKSGVSKQEVEPICRCMADELAAKHSVSELTALGADPDSKESQQKLDKAVEICRGQADSAPTTGGPANAQPAKAQPEQ